MRYMKSIGLNSNQQIGRGFNHPYDVAFSYDQRIYVLNRMYPQSTDGIRVQICDLDDEWYGEFGHGPGHTNDQFMVPVCIEFDSEERLFITDESHNQIKIFNKDGKFLEAWGKGTAKLRELNGPSGICFDSKGNVLVAQQFDGNITKITPEGEALLQFGEHGSSQGQLNLPWGICVDEQDDVYVADWRNDRIQQFDSEGRFLRIIGETGSGEGQLSRPSSVAVARDGRVIVADWGNERVQIFDKDGQFDSILQGQATLSKWAIEWLDVNRDELNARQTSDLEIKTLPSHLNTPYHRASQTEHIFWGPVSVKIDREQRLYVTEHSRHRIQIYQLD
ncbi:MAG: NHL repeat-containing protein [Chloroflexota bacterium]|nr:NHL repeat-containing protein [Chloroflexota bacterium]